MKKLVFSLIFCLLTAANLHANQITIINMLTCDVSFYFNMTNPDVHSQEVIIPASMTTVYADGSMVPTLWSSPTTPAQMALATFSSVMLHPVDPTPGSSGYGFLSATVTPYNSAPYAPACYGSTFSATWFPGTNVVILIF